MCDLREGTWCSWASFFFFLSKLGGLASVTCRSFPPWELLAFSTSRLGRLWQETLWCLLWSAHRHSVPGSRPLPGSQNSFCTQPAGKNLKRQVQGPGLTSSVLLFSFGLFKGSCFGRLSLKSEGTWRHFALIYQIEGNERDGYTFFFFWKGINTLKLNWV